MFKVGQKVIFTLPCKIMHIEHHIIIYGQIFIVSYINKHSSFQLKELPYFTFNLEDHKNYFELISQYRKRKINKILNGR